MTEVLLSAADMAALGRAPTPIHVLAEHDLTGFLDRQPAGLAELASSAQFKARAGQVLVAPGLVLFGVSEAAAVDDAPWRALPTKVPSGEYRIEGLPLAMSPAHVALAWAQGAYVFDRYKTVRGDPRPGLVVADGVDLDEVRALADACALARDLINTPANDMGPVHLELAAREVAAAFGASAAAIIGDALLEANYPAIHAVGRAADPTRAPRLVELTWTGPDDRADLPLVAVIGKGVVFDTGGLDLKPSSGMRLMKKDMGGAAHALALARMVMAARLPIRLVVLLPLAENAISGDAMRPGDVIASRKGLSIEIGNTDAEGRLILADALTRAGELEPALTIDLATLTGAARAALGPFVIPFYTSDEALAEDLAGAGRAVGDPLWRMPLWAGYDDALDSDIADLKNDPDGWAQAGSVTAALFLQRFAPKGAWVHFDIFAWNPKSRPGFPTGAEAQAIRALYAVLKARYG